MYLSRRAFAVPGGPSGPSGLPTPRSLGGTPDTPPGRVREGGFQCVESAEVATGGGMQSQGGISAPGWRLLQAIAGVHLTKCPDRECRGPAWVPGYFGTSAPAMMHSTYPGSPCLSCPPRTSARLPTPPCSTSCVWVAKVAGQERQRKSDPQAPQGWTALHPGGRAVRLSLSKPTSNPMPAPPAVNSTKAPRQRQMEKEPAFLQALT